MPSFHVPNNRCRTTQRLTPLPIPTTSYLEQLVVESRRRAPLDATEVLEDEADETIGAVLQRLHSSLAYRILLRFPQERRERILPLAGERIGEPWADAQQHPEGSVGRLMEPVVAVFPPDMPVAEAVEEIRAWVRKTVITYGYVVDARRRLLGVLVMRDLLLAQPGDRLDEVMLSDPFSLRPDMPVGDAMKEVVYRH